MASIAIKAAMLDSAVKAVEGAMYAVAEAQGKEAPTLPTSKDPMIEQAERLQVIAEFLRSIVIPVENAPAVEAVAEGSVVPVKRGRKPKAE